MIGLNNVSKSFCLAKWYRTTLTLDTGETQSCHHCSYHKVSLDQIKQDPSKLTNTNQIKENRQQMLDGKRPEECNYCWSVEDNGDLSDRWIKSYVLINNHKHKDLIFEAKNNLSVIPSQLEISFDNTCNLKCSYCGPKYSSKWEEELNQYGHYPTTTRRKIKSDKILNRDYNPYIDAFWKWWPELKNNLDILRITGGEPLLSKNTYKMIDKIIEEDTSFKLHINSNLSINIDRLIDKLQQHPDKFQGFLLYTSLESGEEKSTYSRYGLDYKLFTSNVEKYLQKTQHNISFMSTINLLSITGFYDFLNYYVFLKDKYGDTRLGFSAPFLREPAYLSIRLLPKTIKEKVSDQLLSFQGVSETEMKKIKSLVGYMNGEIDNKQSLRKDFVKFINEYDIRRNTNFLETYPEYKEVLENWK